MEKSGIYKYLNNIVKVFFERFYKYCDGVQKCFNIIAFLGGLSTVNFINGPR